MKIVKYSTCIRIFVALNNVNSRRKLMEIFFTKIKFSVIFAKFD